ncbi:beta-ketoacyl-[acyl-carrier-protein] synthase family protein [Vibrio sp.]|uniref:beta-ketoacyl-[acyl-carrier-protein] synthase family protein n=1 Tax=Vibrio sp. TaxID=678 RepID=UPI003D12D16B
MLSRQTTPIYIQDCGFHSAMGYQDTDIHRCLAGSQPANMVQDDQLLNHAQTTVIGRIPHPLASLPNRLGAFDSRNNRLALSALLDIETSVQQAIKQFGADRVAVLVGTSTSGMADGEQAFAEQLAKGRFPADYHYRKQELANCSQFIQALFQLNGPCYTVSTACSSSGRVFITAKRMLQSGMADAVIVGGVDTLCRLTLNGFHGLDALSQTLCQPFSSERDGINIGEASAFMLLSKSPSDIALLGCGDSSDAYHISAPQPEGLGAEQAMRAALDDAGLISSDIGYINAHGTATPLNDSMESQAIYRIFADQVAVSSTKPLTGHTLGAASATEAAIAWHILRHNLPLPQQGCANPGEDIQIQLLEQPMQLNGRAIMSNSFAFGGNNISLIFGLSHD